MGRQDISATLRRVPPTHSAEMAAPARQPLIEVLRVVASTLIVWHHFASYPPLADAAEPIMGGILQWFREYGRTPPVFFVIGGYVLALGLADRSWVGSDVAHFAVGRYCRLGLPYLAAAALAIIASAIGRDWLPESIVGAPPEFGQLVAHVFLLQDILGYESLSAGFWFVCINFQLSLVYVATLWTGAIVDHGARSLAGRTFPNASFAVNVVLALASLFYFNRRPEWDVWPIYYYAYFFFGVVLQYGWRGRPSSPCFWAYAAAAAMMLYDEWRSPLALSLATALLLSVGIRFRISIHSPALRVIEYLGRTSYSLFLVHFPVLVLTAAVWSYWEWTSPVAAAAGLATACVVSLGVADLFFRWVECPATRLGRNFGRHSSKPIPAIVCRPIPLS